MNAVTVEIRSRPKAPFAKFLSSLCSRMKCLAALTVLLCAGAGAAEPLVLEKTIPLPGVRGRFDHFSLSADQMLLAVAALGNDTVEIFDLAAGKHFISVAGQKKPCGVLFVPGKTRLLAANGGDGTLRAFDSATWRPAGEVRGLDDADNVRHDRTGHRVVVGYGDGALVLLDERGAKLLGKIPLAAHPEAFQLEADGRRAFVNVPDKRHVAIVNLDSMKVEATWSMEKWHANFPMALDEPHHRVFIGCRTPPRLVALDTRDGRVLGDCEMSGDTDDMFYDPERERIMASCGEGFLDLIAAPPGGKLVRTDRQATSPGARTSFFSTSSDRLYLAVPERNGHDAELRIFRP